MKFLLAQFLTLLSVSLLYGQCAIIAVPTSTSITCSDSASIVIIDTTSPGYQVIDFNSSSLPTGWTSNPQVIYTNPCTPSLDGSPTAWFGFMPVSSPREMVSPDYDFSCGGVVSFEMDYASDDPCGSCGSCEDPDSWTEGVTLQYSTDAGSNWNDIYFFQPVISSQNSHPYYSWNNWSFTVPPAAWSPNTRFRWIQFTVSGAAFDHWGLDNIVIAPTNCSYSGYYYDWGGSSGDQDSAFYLTSSTTFDVIYTNGVNDTCTASTTIQVDPFNAGFEYDSMAFCIVSNSAGCDITGDPGGIFSASPTGLIINQNFGHIDVDNSAPGTYSVTYESPLPACMADSTIMITIYDEAPVFAGPDTTLCEGSSITLTADNPYGLAFSWDSGVTDGVPFVPPLGSNAYVLTGNPGQNCNSSDVVNVNVVNTGPTVSAGQDTTVSSADTITLTAFNPGTAVISWSGGIQDGVPFTLTPGVYEFILYATLGCEATDTIVITVFDPPTISGYVVNDNGTSNGSIDVTVVTHGGPLVDILWSTGDTIEDILNLTAGDYTITVTDSAGIQGSETFTVLSTVGIQNGTLTQPAVFPNPTNNGLITINWPYSFEYEIFDLKGRLWVKGNSTGTKLVDLTDLPHGVYNLKLKSADSSFNTRLIR